MEQRSLYEPRFVRELFDEMARTYGIVNLISSIGFARRWRRQCVRLVKLKSDAIVLDLMSGMGELCHDIANFLNDDAEIIAVDISSVMCNHARQRINPKNGCNVGVIEANALHCPLENESVDYVFSAFGLKTFDQEQVRQLAAEVNRVLRPGGQFAFLEISVPGHRLLKWPYLAYINYVIPLIGRLFLGNPDNYRLLGVYTLAFGNCRQAMESFAELRLEATYQSLFFGCASSFFGRKPNHSSNSSR